MPVHSLRRGGRRFGVGESASAFIAQTDVNAWVARVVANGGAAPSTSTQIAIDTFYSGLINNGLLSSMVVVNCFVPDNLTAACTPLIANAGNSLWTNSSFVNADLNTSGLKGDGVTKVLKTGIVPSTATGLTNTSAGVSLLLSIVPASSAMVDFGGQSGTDNSCSLYNFSGSAFLDLWGTSGGNRTSAALPTAAWPGFITGNRTGASLVTLYRASTANPFASFATNTTAQTDVRSSVELYVLALNNAGTAINFSNRTVSFVAVHAGLSSAGAQALYNLVVTLRTALGGGSP